MPNFLYCHPLYAMQKNNLKALMNINQTWLRINGIVHAAYVAIATTAKSAVQNQLDIETATALALKTNQILRLFVYPIFALLSITFIYQVLKRKTLYPRWVIFFFPLIPFLFQSIIGKTLSGSVKTIIMGGYLNLIIVLFFAASTIALWNSKTKRNV
ncbi:MAG: hypothetical protein KAH17_01770, partial [Bacteroidales bacterium]|nr:hypothetical protein [Bacteroidales bacterium]